jgi:hypothetical protein
MFFFLSVIPDIILSTHDTREPWAFFFLDFGISPLRIQYSTTVFIFGHGIERLRFAVVVGNRKCAFLPAREKPCSKGRRVSWGV